MSNRITDSVLNILACPYCGGDFEISEEFVICSNCQSRYEFDESGVLDLRLQRKKANPYTYQLGTPLFQRENFEFELLQKNDNPEVDFSGFKIPRHLSKEIMSYFPKAKMDNSLMLV